MWHRKKKDFFKKIRIDDSIILLLYSECEHDLMIWCHPRPQNRKLLRI